MFVWGQAVLREVLEDFLPVDAHIRSNGRVRGEHILFLRAFTSFYTAF